MIVGTGAKKELATNHNSEQRKSRIPGGECIEDNTRSTTDDHGTKKGRPPLPYEVFDHVVSSHNNGTCYCGTYEKYCDDKRQ